MTEFQLALLIVGAVAVAAVLLYNKVQERVARQRAERAFGSRHADVLLEAGATRREPTFDAAGRTLEHEARLVAEFLPDPRLDYIIDLALPRPLGAATLLDLWAALEHRFAKRIVLAGGDGGRWTRMGPGEMRNFERYRAALQLVSRAGIVSEAELIEFRSQVETLAAGLKATASAPEMKVALEIARELDQFCVEADIQVAFHLVAPSADGFERAQVRAAAEGAGLAAEPDGQYALRDGEGRMLYALGAREGAHPAAADAAPIAALTLALDVPRAPDGRRSFEAMVRLSRQLAVALGGALVDDNGTALDDRALAAIGVQLETVRKALEARGVLPGGSLALRLFS